MSEYIFNVTRGKQTAREIEAREKIAAKHGCSYTYYKDPGNGWIGWYSGPNLGSPFDGRLSAAVTTDESDAGL